MRRWKEREGEGRPPPKARLRDRSRLRGPRRLNAQVIEAALAEVDPELIREKLESLWRCVQRVSEKCPEKVEVLIKDFDLQDTSTIFSDFAKIVSSRLEKFS